MNFKSHRNKCHSAVRSFRGWLDIARTFAALLSTALFLNTQAANSSVENQKGHSIEIVHQETLSKWTLGPRRKPGEPLKYISLDLDNHPFEQIRKRIEAAEQVKLKSRGESHITLITPPEFVEISTALKGTEIVDQIRTSLERLKPSISSVCVGRGIVGEKRTYFVVLHADDLKEVRRDLLRRAQLKAQVFKPDVFYPHVTVGFTDVDLHMQDGIVKDSASCIELPSNGAVSH